MRGLPYLLTVSSVLAAGPTLVGCDAQPPEDRAENPTEDSKGALDPEEMVGFITGKVPLQWGFVEGDWRAGWVIGDGRVRENLAAAWVSEVYVMCAEEGFENCPMEVAPRGDNVFATVPRDGGYSPYWQVVRVKVPDDYVDSSIKSIALINESGWETERLEAVVNCPVHDPLAWLEGGGQVRSNIAWYDGHAVNYWDFGFVEMVDGTIPAADGYVLYRDDGEPLSELSEQADLNNDGDQADTNDIIVWPSDQASARVELTRVDLPENAVSSVDVETPEEADYTTVDSLQDGDAVIAESLGFVNFGLRP